MEMYCIVKSVMNCCVHFDRLNKTFDWKVCCTRQRYNWFCARIGGFPLAAEDTNLTKVSPIYTGLPLYMGNGHLWKIVRLTPVFSVTSYSPAKVTMVK